MKVAWVSTFPPTLCGIATYSFFLTKELSNEIFVSRIGKWRPGSIFFPFQIFHEIVKTKPDIVHVQHEYMMYGPAQRSVLFPFLLFFLKFYRRPIVVTMHTVILIKTLNKVFFAAYRAGGRFSTLKRYVVILFTKSIGWFSNRIMVHSERGAHCLISEYGFKEEKVSVIPHSLMAIPSQVPIKKKTEKFIIAQFGFIKDSKGIDHVLNILPKMRERFSIHFLLVGATRDNPEEVRYTLYLKNMIKKRHIESCVTFFNFFVPFEELPSLLSKADVFVFPYTERLLSDSGALKVVLPYGKPIIATNIRSFQDLGDSIILIDSDSIESELYEALVKFLINRNLREEYRLKALKLAENYDIKKITKKTLKVYEELLRR